ncbi:MAG: type II toxin-antitoxin system HipA family toxin [Clostridiales bacterium]|nr:type II toxin-antitoxin system HipA family toxin [Clostridiales bacterium]
MSNCLCCGKPLRSEASEKFGWHASCVKKFFGTSAFPDIDVSKEVLEQLALDSTNKGFTVPGVQKKLSLHLTEGEKPRLTLVNYPTGYILKPQTEDYAALPEMEYAVMQMAKATGIFTVPLALVKLSSQENAFAYITKRIDREDGKTLAMEDFCQLDGRLTEDKYRGSYERCGKIVNEYSCRARLDLSELFLRIVFSFAVGNSDMHLKNFSLIETEEGSAEYRLSAAYDMLSTNVVIPADKEQMALTIKGKKQNIRRKDFLVLAGTIGLDEKIAEKLIEKIVKLERRYLDICAASYMPDEMKEELCKLIQARLAILK